MLLLLAFWLQASNRVLELHAEFQAPPICVWCCVAVAFVAPFGKQSGRFLWSTRAMLWRTIGRVLAAPFFPVRFRDVLVGDILTSMVVVGKDLVHFLCFLQADAFGSASSWITPPTGQTTSRIVSAVKRWSPGSADRARRST